MNLARYSLDNTKVIYFFLALLMIGGIASFNRLEKKEDAPFVIKQAVLIAQYPGATPAEVEKLVTEPIEREIQSMRRVYKITSDSYYGMAKITIELLPTTPASEINQMWDELRRKILSVEKTLPAGARIVSVNDDFGDVYGIYYGLTAEEGYSYKDLRDWAQELKTKIVTIDGVQKVALYGEQREVINIFISLPKLANLGMSLQSISHSIQTQNQLIDTGEKMLGEKEAKMVADGTYKNLDDIRNQLITSNKGTQVRLGDIANVEKGYLEPPTGLMRINGKRGVGIGVSMSKGKDVVKTGQLVKEQLEALQPRIPAGIDLLEIYPEDKIASEANAGFIINLLESLFIVIVIIMAVMGFRAGVLIGSSLLFSIGGTLLIMLYAGEGLNRTSLAGFIIAMGMLVDNAIVVTDNAQIGILKGLSRRQALIDGATGPQWGLLGATLIGIFSFLPLYLAPEAVAEIVKPLFVVLAISLILSWVLALTQTTTFGNLILKEKPDNVGKDPYDKKFYHQFETFLSNLIERRWLTLGTMTGLLVASLVLLSLMPQNFFPNMDKPFFRADLHFPDGYNIRTVEKEIKKIEADWLIKPGVKSMSITIGGSPVRYYLASSSVGPKDNFANVLMELHDSDSTAIYEEEFDRYIRANYPNILCRSALFALSPVPDANIEIGFVGEDVKVLSDLTEQVKQIMREEHAIVRDVRSSWGDMIPVWMPEYSQEKGQRLGITRNAMAQSITLVTSGIALGEYREGDVFMPILLKDIDIDNFNPNNFGSIPVPTSSGSIAPLEQVTNMFEYRFDYSLIKRLNREKMMLAQCDPQRGQNAAAAFSTIYKRVKEEVRVPVGYKLTYYGEAESKERSNKALADNLPLTFILIFIILLFLFGNYGKPAVILMMLPLIFIGVVAGLAVFGKSLDFFAILGLLGLIGMNIKNAIVLVDQIGIEINDGKEPLTAVIDATKTRIIPVTMASGTTILGMLPLLFDSMFGGMAATIMGGLMAATILTLLVLPVTYCTVYKIRK